MNEFKKTEKQSIATKIMAGIARYIMLYGGSRSGKTFILVRSIVVRASKVKSRHCILRDKFNHAKTSIWLDTLPKVMKLCFPDLSYEENKSDYYITLPNGSEIWVAGLDDSDRVEKILGKEYSTMYFNECSQISYQSITTALTRLAELNSLTKKAYFDQNPPSKKHWSYWLFEKGLDPIDNVSIDRNEYASLLMNPRDNIENIDPDYIEKILDKLPEKQRKRFRDGEFSNDDDGQAYYSFNREEHVRDIDKSFYVGQKAIGMDFNVCPMTAVVGYYVNNIFYVIEEVFLENSDTFKMSAELLRTGHKGANIYPDSTGINRKTSGKSDHLILKDAGFTVKYTRNPIVFDRVNNVNRLFMEGRIVIDSSCKKLINDLEKVSWKDGSLDQAGANKMLTHISDAFAYWLWGVDPIKEAQPKGKQIQL